MSHDHLTLQGFLDLVPDEAHAEALFLSARWPDGPVCRWCRATGNARQLGFRLGLQYRTSWHLSHRVRRMMEADDPVLRWVVKMDESDTGNGASAPLTTA